MRRLFGLSLLAAIALGLYLLPAGPDGEPTGAGSRHGAPFVYSGWALGLFMGLLFAWLAGVDWRHVPERITAWARLQRHRLGWMLIGCVCTGILLLL
jgi:hypothetical protein